MSLAEVLDLNNLEIGVVLFSGQFRLSRGSQAFQEYILSDFIHDHADVMGEPKHEGLMQSVNLVQRVVAEMKTAMPLGLH